jgi:undecaprenyl-diphosphatase
MLAADPSTLGADRAWFLDVNEWARDTSWLHGPMQAFATYGVLLFGALLVAGWLLARRSGEARQVAASVWAGVATLLAVAVNQPIVAAVNEPRPYRVLSDVLLLGQPSTDPSFPSDHATMAGAVAVGLVLVSRRLGAFALIAALLMAFTRVYVGAHYPDDVIAGLALGAVVALVGWLAVARPLEWLVDRVSDGPLHVLVRQT